MAQNIINERFAFDVSSAALVIPSGGGNVEIPGFGFREKKAHRVVGVGPSLEGFQNSDTVFIKRIRFYSPWLAFGAQIQRGNEGLQEQLLFTDASYNTGNSIAISCFSTLGEWVDINTILPKSDLLAGTLNIDGSVENRTQMIFPASVPSSIVGKSVYLYLQIELCHTLPVIE